MVRIKLVKTARHTARNRDPTEDDINHGTKVMKELVMPWAKTNRLVVADSYFASVQAAEELFKVGLRFTGVVKTATKRFPVLLFKVWNWKNGVTTRLCFIMPQNHTSLTSLLLFGVTETGAASCLHVPTSVKRIQSFATEFAKLLQLKPMKNLCA